MTERRIIQLGGAGGKAPGEPGQPGKRARIENGRLIIEDDGGGEGGKGACPHVHLCRYEAGCDGCCK